MGGGEATHSRCQGNRDTDAKLREIRSCMNLMCLTRIANTHFARTRGPGELASSERMLSLGGLR
jgi:hypothetical protein